MAEYNERMRALRYVALLALGVWVRGLVALRRPALARPAHDADGDPLELAHRFGACRADRRRAHRRRAQVAVADECLHLDRARRDRPRIVECVRAARVPE